MFKVPNHVNVYCPWCPQGKLDLEWEDAFAWLIIHVESTHRSEWIDYIIKNKLYCTAHSNWTDKSISPKWNLQRNLEEWKQSGTDNHLCEECAEIVSWMDEEEIRE
jgi:hypothetical protein